MHLYRVQSESFAVGCHQALLRELFKSQVKRPRPPPPLSTILTTFSILQNEKRNMEAKAEDLAQKLEKMNSLLK